MNQNSETSTKLRKQSNVEEPAADGPDRIFRVGADQDLLKPEVKISHLSNRNTILLGLGLFLVIVTAMTASTAVAAAEKRKREPMTRTQAVLTNTPLIDGNNDLAWQIRVHHNNRLEDVNLLADMSGYWEISHTDIPRMREGRVGAQFWSAYTSCDAQYKDATSQTLDQIDVIRRMINKYPSTFQFVTTSDGIMEAFRDNKIASLIGVESGHSIDSSLAKLRQFYNLGVRYLTLTGDCSTPWADAHNQQAVNGGLSEFGKVVIQEMNRLGMIVDLSGTHPDTMRDVLEISEAPVIFSHSAAYEKCKHTRNVPDDVLLSLRTNNGIVMVNFNSDMISCDESEATLMNVADHIDYIRRKIGATHVGLGAEFDGIVRPATGLEDTSKYPALIMELISRGWADEEVELLVGKNLLQVFEWVEQVRNKKYEDGEKPHEDVMESQSSTDNCRSEWNGLQ
ncbi:dipeptidase 1-like [Saccoglossus kowalevskii]|uniref:Dipeptidase n=1 Tax=Saccoglossus kowalevskii TaxID=10224 RepID=A0ABM0LXV7_SACKO|nr:PREDICTED: dipeptidase 1-like [Saccoglossus kowalevskii]